MTNPRGPSRSSPQNSLLKLLANEFPDAHQAYELFDEFLRNQTYRRTFCLKLIDIAKQRTEGSWDIRRLATLMAEHQILKLNPDNLEDFDAVLTQLTLKERGLEQEIDAAVLREGYSTTELCNFVPEFRRKLARLDRVHKKIRGRKTPDSTLREFIELSRHDCKLSLARYLFTPEDVVNEILRQMQITEGVKDLDIDQPHFVYAELAQALNLLPEFEARILKGLSEVSKIYWVAETTSSKINSLVEYPVTTVVLVIKPPGSDIEFEIKRAGRRGNNVLSVVSSRNGNSIPPSHRLDGGSMQWLLRYEAHNASKLRAIYRLVHGTEAPMPTYISRTTVFSVPVRDGEEATFRYFTEARIFGEGFRQMRVAMEAAVAALEEEEGQNLPELPGDMALTAEFLSHVAPAQAILSGTSSFRVDKLATYLSGEGAERYFKDYLAVDYGEQDKKGFADELLDEVLGVYQPPVVAYENFEQYLEAAFSGTQNRARADQIFLSLVGQIAKFWGTLLAVRGHSHGESFVARNVGIRSVWNQAEWRVRIIFMDHDGLSLPELENGHFFAQNGLQGMIVDERHIWGRANPDLFPVSLLGCLQRIYRVGSELEAQAQSLAMVELKAAYRKTQQALLTNQEMRAFFSQVFISRLFDWDTFVTGYLKKQDNLRLNATWEKEMKKMLAAKGYDRDAVAYYTKAAERYRGFLERTSFLFDDSSEEFALDQPEEE